MAEKSRMLRMTRAVQGARWTITTRNLTPAHVKISSHGNIYIFYITSWVSPSILGMHQLWRSYSNTAWVFCIFRGCMSSRKLSWCHETEWGLMVGAGHGAEHSPLTAGTFINLCWSTISRFETSRYPVACRMLTNEMSTVRISGNGAGWRLFGGQFNIITSKTSTQRPHQ